MKILNICGYTWAIGGPARIIYDHTTVALSLGHSVDILSPASANDLPYPVPTGARLIVCPKTTPISRFFNEFSWDLYKYLKAHIHEYDIVHCHGIWHWGSIAPFIFKNNVPKVITIHGLLDQWALKHSYWKKKIFSVLIQKKLLKRANLIQINNQDERNDLYQYLGFQHSNVVILPNAIPLADLMVLPAKGAFRSRIGVGQGQKLILFMGRLNIKKGLDLLLPAFKKYRDLHTDTTLAIAGPDDGYQAEIEQFIAVNNMQNSIKMLGMITGEDKKRALADADVFALTSYSEGFSIAALEAMTAGVACLVSDRIGFDGYVSKYQAALEAPLTVEGVFEGMAKLLHDAQLRTQLGHNAQQMVTENFDIKIVAKKMIEHYQSCQ